MKEAAELSGSIEIVAPAAFRDRPLEARRMVRMAKAWRERPIVDLFDRGVSIPGMAEPTA